MTRPDRETTIRRLLDQPLPEPVSAHVHACRDLLTLLDLEREVSRAMIGRLEIERAAHETAMRAAIDPPIDVDPIAWAKCVYQSARSVAEMGGVLHRSMVGARMAHLPEQVAADWDHGQRAHAALSERLLRMICDDSEDE